VATKVAKPTDKQRQLLKALAGARRVAVITTNGKKKTSIETFKGKPVKVDFPVDRATVESCEKKGWLTLHRFTEDGGTGGVDHYTLTDAGAEAKKAR